MMRFTQRVWFVCAALMMTAALGNAQDGATGDVTVTGRVTSEAGAPIAGASVFLQGLNIGTQTGEDGRYSFTVSASRATGQSATLIARVIGYTAKNVQITLTAGQTITQNFALSANPLRLGEIVITGAGTSTTREKLATTINSVDSSLIRRATAPQNVVSALAGAAPNVEIRTQSGDPGSSASIRIRGASTILGTSQPLFVVDGQPINNETEATSPDGLTSSSLGGTVSQNRAADINPNDIESIEILKGSAASAIYGARAANGVVLITTKSGHSGPTRYSFSTTNTWDRIKPEISLQRQFGQGTEGAPPSGGCTPANSACTRSWGAQLSSSTPTYDHLSEIFRTGITSDNNLSVSGGNDRTTFYASGGLTAQRGAIVGPNNKYNRTSVRLKASHQMTGELNIGGNFNYIDSRGRYVQKGSNTSGLLLGALRTPPDFNNKPYLDPLTGMHRSYRLPEPSSGSERTGRGYDNPFFVAANSGNRSELGRIISNINADWTPLAWLNVKYTLGADYYNDWRLETLPLSSSSAENGRVYRDDFNNLEIDHNLLATASYDFNERFQGRLTLGQNLNSQRLRQIYVLGDRLNAAAPYAIQNTINFVPTENRSLEHIEAYFGQAELDVLDQLFFSASLRNDGFSTFGSQNRRAWYPKASVSWIFTRALESESDEGIMNFGKLRMAYGETGQQPPAYATVTALSSEVTFGSGFGELLNINQSGVGGLGTYWVFGNPDLKPERQKEFEIGADFGFFDQKMDLGITYYNKQSRDVIIRVPINAAQNGGLEQYANAASLSNKGIELTINGRPYESENTGVELGFSFARNRGKVLNLAGAEFVGYNEQGFNGSGGSSTVGYAPGVIRGNDFVRCGRGLIVDGVDIDAECQSSGAANGALYLDSDGWPMLDAVERVIADPNPKYTMSFNTSIRFLGKFRLSALFDLRKGGQVWDGTRGALYSFGTHADTRIRTQVGQFGKNFLTDMYPNVTGPGAGVDAFASLEDWELWFLTYGGSGGPQQQFVEDGSFVKWRELSLSYTLDQPFVRSLLGFSTADIRIAGRNLVTWTKYRGLDPESNLQGAQTLTQGIDYFNNPQTRSFVLSISLNR